MALQTFGTSIGTGVRAPLGDLDNAFVAAGDIVSSTDDSAVVGTGSNQFVHVMGTVTAHGFAVVLGDSVLDQNDYLLVDAGGYVGNYSAGVFAVLVQASASAVENRGRIAGLHPSGGFAVEFAGDGAGESRLVNSGTIEASGGAILTIGGEALSVTNSGSIKAPTAFFDTGLGSSNRIVNTGSISGSILLGAGDDFYFGAGGRLTGTLFGGAGNDTAEGGIDDDIFEGNLDNDTLFGNGGRDTLKGNEGSDKLYGGPGKDVLTGGNFADVDFFVFNTAPNSATNFDAITDFTHGVDKIQMENAIFTKLGAGAPHALNPAFFRAGAVAADANDFIVYNRATGALYYDSNANAPGGAVLVASLVTNKPVLSAGDFAVI